MTMILVGRHLFPPAIIPHTVWLYLRFTLSYRDVEDLLGERGFANIGRRQLGQRVELGHTEGWSASKRINAPQNPVAAPARAASFAKQACRTDPARRMARPRIP